MAVNNSTTKVKNTKKVSKESEKNKLEIKKPPILFEQTQAELAKLSKVLGCPVLSYFKPPAGNIWPQDLYGILECLKVIGKVPKLAIYIRSNGGQGMVSLRIINLLRSYCDEIIILAPSECASAATMLALGCDEIYMGPLSSLSPVDSSLTHQLSPMDKFNNSVPVSLDELWRVLRLWKEAEFDKFDPENHLQSGKNPQKIEFGFAKEKDMLEKAEKNPENPYKYLYEYIHPLVFGAVDRYSSLSVRICKEILGYHLKDEKTIEQITKSLNYDYPAHSYPITINEAKKIGLPVKEMNGKILDCVQNLQLLYSELTEEKITDYDNAMYHDQSIYSLIETFGVQVSYQQNYDKFYRESEKRYITLNDLSGWYKTVWNENKSKKKLENFTTSRIFF